MTLIISDGKRVIADSIEMVNDTVETAAEPKIKGFKDKVCGIAGMLAYREVLFEWADKYDCDPEHLPKHLAGTDWVLIVFKAEAAYYYTADLLYPDKYPYPCAFGGAAMYTHVALKMGLDVEDIATKACEVLSTAALPLAKIEIPDPVKPAKVKKRVRA